MKRSLIILLSVLIVLQTANAQNWHTVSFYPLDYLIKGKNAAKTELEKTRWLALLSLKYNILAEKTKVDSCIKERKDIALNSRDRVVMSEHYAWEIIGIFNSNDSIRSKRFALCNELIEFGQRENVTVAKVVGNGYLGWGLAKEGKMEQAFSSLNSMLSAALESGDDSLIAESYAFYTNTYYDKNNYLQAYKYQLKALEIAEKMNNGFLLWDYNTWLSNIYRKFKDKEKSMDYRMKLLEFARKTKEPYDDLAAIKSIGIGFLLNSDFVSAEQYHLRCMQMADSLKLERQFIQWMENGYIFQLLFGDNKNESLGFEYLEKEPQRWANYYNSRDQVTKDYLMHLYHRNHKNPDSAAYYIKKSYALDYAKTSDVRKKVWHARLGRFLKETGKFKESTEEWKKALAFSEKLTDLEGQKETAYQIYDLSKKTGNNTDALLYHEKYKTLSDSLESINNKNDLTLAELVNEQRAYETAKLEETENTRKRHQLQYMGITIGVITFFVFSMMLGFFRVSERSLRILGFFAFIFVFEFIIMLADKQIHNWTHGEPLKIFLIKIGLVALLLPLHQLIEKKVIHFLVSRKLMRMRDGRFWRMLFGDVDVEAKVEKT